MSITDKLNDMDREEQEKLNSKLPASYKTLKDEFFMAALTGLLIRGSSTSYVVEEAWRLAKESIKQRK